VSIFTTPAIYSSSTIWTSDEADVPEARKLDLGTRGSAPTSKRSVEISLGDCSPPELLRWQSVTQQDRGFELASVIETLEYPAISMRICLVQEYRYPDALLGGASGQKQSCLNVC
jgi:hypothetical protein